MRTAVWIRAREIMARILYQPGRAGVTWYAIRSGLSMRSVISGSTLPVGQGRSEPPLQSSRRGNKALRIGSINRLPESASTIKSPLESQNAQLNPRCSACRAT